MAAHVRRLVLLRSRTALALLALAASGCDPAVRAAQGIAEKNAEARGGLEAWQKVQTMRLAGHLEAGVPRDPLRLANAALQARRQSRVEARRAAMRAAEAPPAQAQLPFTLELRRPHATRLEVEVKGEKAVQVYDGRSGWKLRPFLGRHEVEPFSEEELTLASHEGWLDGMLMDAAAKGLKLELAGTEQVEGKDAYKLTVTSRDGRVRHLWVDPRTSLEVRIDGTRRLDGKQRTVYTYFRDYRPEEGLLVPHTLETVVDGVAGSEKILVERVVLNPELADARFARPQ